MFAAFIIIIIVDRYLHHDYGACQRSLHPVSKLKFILFLIYSYSYFMSFYVLFQIYGENTAAIKEVERKIERVCQQEQLDHI